MHMNILLFDIDGYAYEYITLRYRWIVFGSDIVMMIS